MPSGERAWVGDWSNCYLLQDGWYASLLVNKRLLRGNKRWLVPTALGDRLGLEGGEEVALPALSGSDEELTVLRTSEGYWGTSPAELGRLKAKQGDLAFVTLSPEGYSMTVMDRTALSETDDLGRLFWRCGIGPADPIARESPWETLSRVLGGTGRNRSDVVDRFRAREQAASLELLGLIGLEIANHRAVVETDSTNWWWHAPLNPDTSHFAVDVDGQTRVAVGVRQGAGGLPQDFMVTEGGLVWVDSSGDFAAKIASLPFEVQITWDSTLWVRWARVEHALRRLLFADPAQQWFIRFDQHWYVDPERFDSLLDALEAVVRQSPTCDPDSSAKLSPLAWLATGTAYSMSVTRAIATGITSLSGSCAKGFLAAYPTGDRTGFSLFDVIG